jgi:hypothetical protein
MHSTLPTGAAGGTGLDPNVRDALETLKKAA